MMAAVMLVSVLLLTWRIEAALLAAAVPLLAGYANILAGTAYRATILVLALTALVYALPDARWGEVAYNAVETLYAMMPASETITSNDPE